MLDIVVLYCNDNDTKWKEQYNYYKQEEISTNKANIANRQSFGEERYRDWGAFKYWFRGVDNNCNWLNKIFLVVSDESQIPDWLDTTNSKLRIVYHKEFIPEELLKKEGELVEGFAPEVAWVTHGGSKELEETEGRPLSSYSLVNFRKRTFPCPYFKNGKNKYHLSLSLKNKITSDSGYAC